MEDDGFNVVSAAVQQTVSVLDCFKTKYNIGKNDFSNSFVYCECLFSVPPEYFNHLDHTGRRVDAYDRPELCLGTYEFAATKDYCKVSELSILKVIVIV